MLGHREVASADPVRQLEAVEVDVAFVQNLGCGDAGGAFADNAETLLLHPPAPRPRGNVPVLVLGSPDDRLAPIAGIRATASTERAPIEEFPGIGHDLMLDAR